jgi:predicted nucleic acid-binding protein
VSATSLYLDTSAWVKLYVSEAESLTVRKHVGRSAHVATSRVGYAEARAAFARRAREGHLRPAQLRRCVARLDDDWRHMVVVELDATLARTAGELAERHALRGFDAIHLASAIRLGMELGRPPAFLAFDAALRTAAATEGLTVL